MSAVATGEEIERLHALVREVPAAENVVDFATRLVRATRPAREAPEFVQKWVRWGAGPARRPGAAARRQGAGAARGTRSWPHSRTSPPSRSPVLRHRVLVNFQAEADGIDADAIVGRLLSSSDP